MITTSNMVIPIDVFAESTSATFSGTCGDNITWTLDDNGVLNICGSGEMSSLREYITSISYHPQAWFKDDLEDKIKEVIIEDGITSIGDYAFANLYNLQKIQIPDTVVSVGKASFQGCGLTSVDLPRKLESIGDYAFSGSDLTSINLPLSLYSIGAYAFSRLYINEICIPASVTYIGIGAFMGGSNSGRILPKITVDENNENYCSLNGSLFSKDKKTLIMYSNHDKSKTYSIPENVEKIQDYAFYWCGNLTSVGFNNNLVYYIFFS